MKFKGEIKQFFLYAKWIARDTKPFVRYLVLILAINVVSALSGVAIAIVSKNLIDTAIKANTKITAVYAITFSVLILVTLGLRAISSMISVRALETFSNRVRQRLFSQISRTEWIAVSKYHSGDILTRLTSDVGTVAEGIINTFPNIISLGVQLVAAFVTLLYYEPYLAVMAFILGPVTILFSRIWGRKLKHLQVKVQEAEGSYRSFIQESLQNLLIIKSFQLEEQSIRNIENLHNGRMRWIIERNNTSVAASTMLGLGYWGGYLLAFLWGAVQLGNGVTTFGTLTAFLQLVGQIQGPFTGLSRNLPQVISTIACAGRLMELEALPIENYIKELPTPNTVKIYCNHVTFSYPDKQTILKEASMTINPGEIVALVGASGEGKTTLIRIIMALLKPDSGRVFFKDQNNTELNSSAETRSWVSYVPQGNTLFSGTIADNIRCGYSDASLEELKAAACAANAWEFIENLPEGINTVIGERGIGLSEGQAQRIAIARALLRKTPILILDEATSALDINSEMCVLKGIREMLHSRTCIVITHRPSALNICSRVLKLEDGCLMEAGIDYIGTKVS